MILGANIICVDVSSQSTTFSSFLGFGGPINPSRKHGVISYNSNDYDRLKYRYINFPWFFYLNKNQTIHFTILEFNTQNMSTQKEIGLIHDCSYMDTYEFVSVQRFNANRNNFTDLWKQCGTKDDLPYVLSYTGPGIISFRFYSDMVTWIKSGVINAMYQISGDGK